MSARSCRRIALVVAATTLASLTSAVSLAGSARADEASDAPVTADDSVTVRTTSYGQTLDVLANDSDPNGDELKICRIELPDNAPISVERGSSGVGSYPVPAQPAPASGREDASNETLVIHPQSNKARAFTFTYYACDLDYLTPATVTVTLKPTPPVRAVKVAGQRGVLRFTNPGDRRVVVLYGGPREDQPDGRFALAPGASTRVRVERHNIFFIAFVRRTGEVVNVGIVHRIALPGDRGDFTHADSTRRDRAVWRTSTAAGARTR